MGIHRSEVWAAVSGCAFMLGLPTKLWAADGWAHWWLPHNYSVHGRNVDSLFNWIFWITMVTFVAVQITLVVFLIKYRRRPGKAKGTFIHGNTRLEMAWTLAPAVILAILAIASRAVWNQYRFADESRPSNVKPAKVMVIGEQFKWNIVYPGPDGKFGKYLIYPKPTDAKWPVDKDGNPFMWAGVAGPRELPPEQARAAITSYIDRVNRLGKVMDDPDGKDDLWEGSLGRTMEVPVDRPVDVIVGSRDVLHSFSLPNFRTKLDTVPGMMGMISFTPTTLSSETEVPETVTIEQMQERLARARSDVMREWKVVIDENSPGAEKDATGWRYTDTDRRRRKVSIIRDGGLINYVPDDPARDTLSRLKEIGVTEIRVYRPGYFDIACQELCGHGHSSMQGQLYVIPADEYARKYETPAMPEGTASVASAGERE